MSKMNKKGEECDCGSTTEHKRGPGCTPPRSEDNERLGSPFWVRIQDTICSDLTMPLRCECGWSGTLDDGFKTSPGEGVQGRRVFAACPICNGSTLWLPSPHAALYRKVAALEEKVSRLEARPTPPGVFPPRTRLMCAGCRKAGRPLHLVPSGWLTCAECDKASNYAPSSDTGSVVGPCTCAAYRACGVPASCSRCTSSPSDSGRYRREVTIEHGMAGGPLKSERMSLGSSDVPPQVPAKSPKERAEETVRGWGVEHTYRSIAEEQRRAWDAGNTKARMEAAMRRMHEADVRTMNAPIGDKAMVGLDASLPRPAAMLGEALEVAHRLDGILCDVGNNGPHSEAVWRGLSPARGGVVKVLRLLEDAKRAAESQGAEGSR